MIVGNPPYIAAAKIRKLYNVKGFRTSAASDIYAWVLERTSALLETTGRSGMIIPLSLSFSADFDSTRKLLTQDYSRNWFSSFGRIPAALFSHDVRVRNTVHIGAKGHAPSINYSTRLYRWFEGFRPHLVPSLEYACYTPSTWSNRIPKIGNQPLMERFEFLLMKEHEVLGRYISTRRTKHSIYFTKSASNWLNLCREMPPS